MFEIHQRSSTPAREILGGLTTFMAMSYILFLQPALLSKTGMDSGGVFMATCIASAAACFLMAFLANYPIALAPGMGENFFFVFTLCGVGAANGVFHLTWQEALALTVCSGTIFLLLSTVGFRSYLLNSIPDSLKSGIAAGIGLFIALIGFEWGNIIKASPGTYITLATPMLENYVAGLTLLGLLVLMILSAFKIRGAILITILSMTFITWLVGWVPGIETLTFRGGGFLGGIVGMPTGLQNTIGGCWEGFAGLFGKLFSGNAMDVIIFAFIVLFMDMFDTVGTLVGVANRAGLIKNGKLPRAERALAADAGGSILGAMCGTSTITAYIESAAGVASGARTGLAALAAGVCMLAAMFFQPLVAMVGKGVCIGETSFGDPILKYPMIAPALIYVGALMIRAIRDIDWDDITEALPGFLAMITMPFAYNISHGIAIGFISYAAGKLFTGRAKQCPAIVYVFAALFIVRYLLAPG